MPSSTHLVFLSISMQGNTSDIHFTIVSPPYLQLFHPHLQLYYSKFIYCSLFFLSINSLLHTSAVHSVPHPCFPFYLLIHEMFKMSLLYVLHLLFTTYINSILSLDFHFHPLLTSLNFFPNQLFFISIELSFIPNSSIFLLLSFIIIIITIIIIINLYEYTFQNLGHYL